MQAIRTGTKRSKFTVDAVLHESVYYLPSTARMEQDTITMLGCYYNRYRAKWLECTFTPPREVGSAIMEFAKNKKLN